MAKRMIFMLIAVGVFLGAIGFVKFRQIQVAIAQGASYQPPAEAVTTIVARAETWQPTLAAIGTASAVNGVILGADMPGIVETISFESGQAVHAGDLLVRLDSRQEQAQLVAAEAKRDLDKRNLDRTRGLLADGVMAQADYDAAVSAYDQSQANVGEMRATIDRKSIRAPFSGVLGIRQANLGQYLKSGDPIVPLQSVDPIFVNFTVPQQELSEIRKGGEIRAELESAPAVERTGKISAIDSLIDESTRNVKIQATVANPDGRLRPGMYVKVEVVLDQKNPVVPLPGTAISYAPYGDSVFVVEQMKAPDGKSYKGARQQFVKLGPSRGDQVAVLQGIKPGEEIVTSGGFKLRNGASVQVNNDVKPPNDPAPKPEDN